MNLTIIIIIITAIVSLPAFKNQELFSRFSFNPYQIAKRNEWYRFLTHGFVHADWEHLIFNMLSLFFFGDNVELAFGSRLYFLLFYLTALMVSSVPTFLKHKHDPYYSSIGASGAVSAVIFASILVEPSGTIMIFPIPIPIPAFIYGVLFVLYSSNKSKRADDNINHDAHLTGALFGFIVPLLFHPAFLKEFISKLPF